MNADDCPGEDPTEIESSRRVEAYFRALLEHTGEMLLVVDARGEIQYVSPSVSRVLGYSPEEMLGASVFRYLHPAELPQIKQVFQQHLRAPGDSYSIEFRFRHRDGSWRFMEGVSVNLLHVREVAGMAANFREITTRKNSEENLRRLHQEYIIRDRIASAFLTRTDDEVYGEVLRVVLEATESPLGVLGYIDENGDLVTPSMTGEVWQRCEVREKSVVFPRAQWGGQWGRALEVGKPFCSNEPLPVPEGHLEIQRALSVPVVYQGRTIGLFNVANKETDYDEEDQATLESIAGFMAPVLDARLQRDRQERQRRQAERALSESERKYRLLAARLESIREEESSRIARQIHDELGQSLTALKMESESLAVRFARSAVPDRAELSERLRAMTADLAASIDSVKRIGAELRPGVLDHLGLTAAVEWQAREFQARTGIKCRVSGLRDDLPLGATKSSVVFGIFREVLTNIARHAHASEARVRLRVGSRWLILTVSDNGRGMEALQASDPKALGLLGIRERALLIGGQIAFKSSPGRGTTVTLRVPAAQGGAEAVSAHAPTGVHP